MQRWQSLLKKFKKERKAIIEELNLPSGSGRKQEEPQWQHYKQMSFIIPFVEHRPQLSNDATSNK